LINANEKKRICGPAVTLPVEVQHLVADLAEVQRAQPAVDRSEIIISNGEQVTCDEPRVEGFEIVRLVVGKTLHMTN
jgi:hypothetical protein